MNEANLIQTLKAWKALYSTYSANPLAQLVIQVALGYYHIIYWIEDPPNFIMDQLNVDVTSTF